MADNRNHIDIPEEKHFQPGMQRIDEMDKTTSVLEQTKDGIKKLFEEKMGLLSGRQGINYYIKHIESFQGAMTECMFALSVKRTTGLLRDVGRFELVFRDFGSESLLNMKVITGLE